MKKRALSLFMVLVLALGMPMAAFASTQLATPQNLTWGSNYEATWDAVTEADGNYLFRFYKDGSMEQNIFWGGLRGASTMTDELAHLINESGDYSFSVMQGGTG